MLKQGWEVRSRQSLSGSVSSLVTFENAQKHLEAISKPPAFSAALLETAS